MSDRERHGYPLKLIHGVLLVVGMCGTWLLVMPVSPAQVMLFGMIGGGIVFSGWLSRGKLEHIEVEREHLGRVFEGDVTRVKLKIRRGRGFATELMQVQDLFFASLTIRQRHLVPLLTEGWQVGIQYAQRAERHRGLYLLGPVRLTIRDGLGLFEHRREIPTITQMTVYPHPLALPGYAIPGEWAGAGPSQDSLVQRGQGEEILGIREYRHGDARARIHWRSSARRRALHVVQLNRPIQSELLVMLDVTQRMRFGLGAESTTELAIGSATSILTRGHEKRHRLSLSYVQREAAHFSPSTGLRHLHLLLDRLAVLEPSGAADFWEMAGPRLQILEPGSRAVIIMTAAFTPIGRLLENIGQSQARGVAIDILLIDEHDFIRIFKEQEIPISEQPDYEGLLSLIRLAGGRAYPVRRVPQPGDEFIFSRNRAREVLGERGLIG